MNTTIESPNANLHTSHINQMNNARKELWLNVYPKEMMSLLNIVREYFKTNNIIYDAVSESINIETNRTMSNSEAECMMWTSMVAFLNTLDENHHIHHDLFNKCILSPNLLYYIILNNNCSIKIKL